MSQRTIKNWSEQKVGILTRATRNITRRKARAIIVIVALSLALSVVVSIPPTIIANQQANQKLVNEITGQIENTNGFVNSLAVTHVTWGLPLENRYNMGPYQNLTQLTRPFLNIADYSNLTSIPEIDAVIPTLFYEYWDTKVEYFHNDALYISGAPLNASFMDKYASFLDPSPLPSNITEGRNLQVGDSGVVVLEDVVAHSLGVGVGENVTLSGKNFTVVGVNGGTELKAVYLSLEDAQSITNTTGQAWVLDVFVDGVQNLEKVKSKIISEYPELVIIVEYKQTIDIGLEGIASDTERIQDAQAKMNNLERTGMVQIGFIIVAQIVIILFIMLYTVRERTKEIGTLKAMGASNRTILTQFMLEGTLLSLIAGVVSIAIGTVGASTIGNLLLPRLDQYGVDIIATDEGGWVPVSLSGTVTPQIMLAVLGVAVLLGMLGSLYPAWKASKIQPAEAMRHE
ncbi:MAG: FtsX-like permease family protein [Planctomycetes bacterium]|nr:FtsX-like permease family protein [Planctomycetota bacterium]